MSRIIACFTICLLTFLSAACERVPLLAPTGSAVTLSVNTTNVPLNGSAQVTAVVIEAGGTAPQNGTQVSFTTTLGSIDPIDAQTQNGRATVTFHAGNRAGTATIRAFSGDAETEGQDVTVGAGGGSISLRAEATSNGILIVALVLDEFGNPVPGAPVTFSTSTGIIIPGFVNANNVGEARATLTSSQTAEVTATSGAATGSLTVEVGTLTLTLVTTSPEVGAPVNITLTPGTTGTGTAQVTSSFSTVVVDFGDGTPTTTLTGVNAARALSHTYTQRGTYTVTATGTTVTGARAVTSINVTVNDRAPLTVTLTATPAIVSISNVSQQGLVTFTATAAAPTGASISSYDWSFGDGATASTNNASIPYRYIAPGTYTMTVRVRATNGQEGTGQTIVRVNP